jgi:hypothetical protein
VTTFQELLSKNESEIKEPVPVPVGHYRGFMKKYEERVYNRKQPKPGEGPTFSKLICTMTPVEPCSDVNPADLETYNGVGDLTQEEFRQEFWLNDKGLWFIVDWLKTACGCAPGQTVMEMLVQAQGKQGVVFEVRHEISERSKRPYAVVGDFLPFGTSI